MTSAHRREWFGPPLNVTSTSLIMSFVDRPVVEYVLSGLDHVTHIEVARMHVQIPPALDGVAP